MELSQDRTRPNSTLRDTSFVDFKSHNFHFGITTITPLTTLVILVASTRHALLTSHVYLRLAKRPSAQFANSTNKVLRFKNALQASECYSPTSIQARVLVKQASVATYLTRFAVEFFPYDLLNARKQRNYYQQATYEDNFSTCPQPRILFWFTSSNFLKRHVLLKYWLLRPFSTRKPHVKAVPLKDYFTQRKQYRCGARHCGSKTLKLLPLKSFLR